MAHRPAARQGFLTAVERVYGVDFSGAVRAGEKIWIAAGRAVDGELVIESCRPASALPDSDGERDIALGALARLIASEKRAVFGLDFPFSLPAALIEEADWPTFIRHFPRHYPDAEALRGSCRQRDGGRELKRKSDAETKAPFSAYNHRLYRQTYYGIRDVLRPLVLQDAARVVPMQTAEPGKPTVYEICPAATLKRECLYRSYKGNGVQLSRARGFLLRAFEQDDLRIASNGLRRKIIRDTEGDALDAVLAAVGAFRAAKAEPLDLAVIDPVYSIEGVIYV